MKRSINISGYVWEKILFALWTYEKSFQEKVALFKIFISSTKYTSTCMCVCAFILKHIFTLASALISVRKEMTKHLYNNILLHTYISNVNANTFSCITNVVLLRNLWEKLFETSCLALSHVLFTSSSKSNGILQRLLSQNQFRETTFSFF